MSVHQIFLDYLLPWVHLPPGPVTGWPAPWDSLVVCVTDGTWNSSEDVTWKREILNKTWFQNMTVIESPAPCLRKGKEAAQDQPFWFIIMWIFFVQHCKRMLWCLRWELSEESVCGHYKQHAKNSIFQQAEQQRWSKTKLFPGAFWVGMNVSHSFNREKWCEGNRATINQSKCLNCMRRVTHSKSVVKPLEKMS
jgi:hypothetical protein